MVRKGGPMDQDTETQVVQPTQEGATSESQDQAVDQLQDQTQNSESETGLNEGSDIPKENAAWAAQRVKNKQLAEENQRLKQVVESVDPAYLESLRNATRYQSTQPQQVPQVTGDAEYGQVTNGVNWAASQAAIANQNINNLQRQLELQQDREAERAFPELKNDKVFQQIVAEKKLSARVLGHDRTTYEIAEEVRNLLGRREEQVAVKAAQDKEQQILQRQVISSEPKGQTSGGKSSVSNDELRMRVRRGDTQAQTEVAKGIIADLEF